jgi:hypothetical protein
VVTSSGSLGRGGLKRSSKLPPNAHAVRVHWNPLSGSVPVAAPLFRAGLQGRPANYIRIGIIEVPGLDPKAASEIGVKHKETTSGRIPMQESRLLTQFEELADKMGIEIRYEPIKREGGFYPGGLCAIKGQYALIINTQASITDKLETIARALKRFDLSQVYVRPALREYMDTFSDS